MFTIKLYSDDGGRQIIKEAESFTILRGNGEFEITLHQRMQHEDRRYDVKPDIKASYPAGTPPRFAKAIIENSSGRTTQILALGPGPGLAGDEPPRSPPPETNSQRKRGRDIDELTRRVRESVLDSDLIEELK
jgi:hypothetical protein